MLGTRLALWEPVPWDQSRDPEGHGEEEALGLGTETLGKVSTEALCVHNLPCPNSSLSFMMASPVPEARSVSLARDSGELKAQSLSSMETRACPGLPKPLLAHCPDPISPDSILEPRAGADGCQQRLKHCEWEGSMPGWV